MSRQLQDVRGRRLCDARPGFIYEERTVAPPRGRNFLSGVNHRSERQRGGLEGLPKKLHSRLFQRAAPFTIIAAVARGGDVLPYGLSTSYPGHDVIVVEVIHPLSLSTVLAAKTVARED